MTEREFETIIDKLTILENNDKMLAERLEFYSEKLDSVSYTHLTLPTILLV